MPLPKILSGPERLLASLGIDFKQIEAVVTEIVAGIKKNNETLAKIEARLTAIEERLPSRVLILSPEQEAAQPNGKETQ